ncbi:MAG: excinuclease ABC subunit UvrA, partial [Opitutales bacterium]
MPKRKKETIQLHGVRQHNLKGFDLDLPIGQLTVVTGLSGTGKSSLVFKTLHAEGQRRYVETFSPYTRQFMELLDRPAVDRIENIRPSIAIHQSNTVKTSRSTVGTITELCDYFKVWFANEATLHDPADGSPIRDDNPQTIWKAVCEAYRGDSILIGFRVKKPDNLTWTEILKSLSGQGYSRILRFNEADRHGQIQRIDALLKKANPLPEAEGKASHAKASLFAIQDRIKVDKGSRPRFIEAAQQALHFGGGRVHLFDPEGSPLAAYSEGLNSARTGQVFRPAIPALFSFNSPIGACPTCRGFGRIIEIDDRLVIPDHSRSIDDGAIRPFQGEVYSASLRDLQRAARRHGIRTNVPYAEMTEAEKQFVHAGEPRYEEGNEDSQWYGVRRFFDYLESKVYRMHVRVFLSKFRSYRTCPDCLGARLQPEALCWKWRGYTLPDLYQMSVDELLLLLPRQDSVKGPPGGAAPQPNQPPKKTHDSALDGILTRLGFLSDVGLGYLTLDRSSRSLSGGETMRVNLTACLGSALTDTLFVLDEPSVGLHARDMDRLIAILRRLTRLGNTVVVVEHDEAIMRAADHLIEIGPEPGRHGGQLTFQGSLAQLLRSNTVTGRFLSARDDVDIPKQRRPVQDNKKPSLLQTSPPPHLPLLSVYGAEKHNIRGLDLHLPQQRLVCLSGVSGSGKSTLLNNVIYQNLLAEKGQAVDDPATIKDIESTLPVSEIVLVDQNPVSKTPRSNPALFTKAWDEIRKQFAQLDAARSAGMLAGHFSFNGGDGRCPGCSGLGYERIEMQFVSDVFVPCEICEGRRFKDEVLAIEFHGKSIADILELNVDEAIRFFGAYPKIVRALQPMLDVGLGYLKLGQPLNTLSGGESQRLKLVRYLSRVTPPRKAADQRPPDATTAAAATTPQAKTEKARQSKHHAAPSASSACSGGHTLILIDEPTTGLHRADVKRLLRVFQKLVDAGHSLLVIEHNLDVLKSADWIVEMGPGAGAQGGCIVAAGTPEEISGTSCETASYLREALGEEPTPPPS